MRSGCPCRLCRRAQPLAYARHLPMKRHLRPTRCDFLPHTLRYDSLKTFHNHASAETHGGLGIGLRSQVMHISDSQFLTSVWPQRCMYEPLCILLTSPAFGKADQCPSVAVSHMCSCQLTQQRTMAMLPLRCTYHLHDKILYMRSY